jgi:two-component system cell cycle sensor histidine kinase/response regulator CckA
MPRKLTDQPLAALDHCFQALKDKAGCLPEACRQELTTDLQNLAQALAALREVREAESSLLEGIPNGPQVQEDPGQADTILGHVFNAIPDLLTIHDPDYHVVMSNWHWPGLTPAAAPGVRRKCYEVYLHRDRPCDQCQLQAVVATGRPQRKIKYSPVDHRVREIHAFPIRDETGRVALVAEHVRDVTENHLADKALKESEERFRAVFETAQDAIFIKDSSFRYIQVNPAMERLLGQPADHIIGLTEKDLFGADTAHIRKQDQKVLKGEVMKKVVTLPVQRVPTTFHVVKVPLHDDAGQVVGLCGIARDITEVKQAAEALRQKEERLAGIVNAITDHMSMMDRDHNILWANEVAKRLFGPDLISKKCYQAYHRQEKPCEPCIVSQVFQDGQIYEHETEVIGTDGQTKYFWCTASIAGRDPDGTPRMVVEVSRDITKRKRAEAALRESEERFRSLFEYAPDAYLLLDLQGNFLDVNRSFEELTGYAREELIGKNLPLLNDRQKSMVFATFEQAVNGQPLKSLELSLISKDGREHVIEGKAMPLQFKGQHLVLAIARDITARKQAEAALKENEERFRHISSTISDISYSCAIMPNGGYAIDWMAGAVESITGYSLEEIKAHRCWGFLVIEEDLLLFEKYVTGLPVGSSAACELRLRHKDGGIVWVASYAEIVKQQEQPELFRIYGGLVDITARKQAEEALRLSEKRFRDITDNAAEWVWELDAQGQYTYSSPVVEQLLGYKPEEVLGKYFYDFFLPDQQEELKNAGLAVFATQKPFRDFLNPNLHKNGQIVWLSTGGIPILDNQGNLQGYRGADIDVTARREAEELSHNLIAKSPVGIYLVQNGKFQQVNQVFFAITGYTQDDFAQLEPLGLVHPEDREPTRENAVNMLKGLNSVPYEFRIITKGGKTKWIMERLTTIQYQGKRATLGYFLDITERKQLETQLLQAQKMEAVGRLAGGVAHDFNNLLMAITGYGELMRSNVVKDDPLYDYLENILKAATQAAALTQQLLTFSRRQIVHPQELDFKQVLLDLEPMLRRLIGEDIDLEISPEPEPVAVKADPGHLSQIIMNLVVNARDAMPRGGRLILKTTPVNIKKSHPTRFGLIPPGPYVMLVVQDTGAGMAEDIQSHIFEPFFTTKEPGKGTGLGLSTVYGIVKQSGGYLDLDSQLGGGSTFSIYLPRLKTLVEPPKAKIPITATLRGNETILLVEDEDVLRALLAKFLRLHGYTVLEARHGGEALLICERHQGPIHLMVTDVVMPQMSGRELADRLIPLRRDMKVLYMSGYTEDAMVQYDVADLSVPFLQKPFKPLELARQVYAICHPSGPH